MSLGGTLKSVAGAFGSGLNIGSGKFKAALGGAGIGATLGMGAVGAAIGAGTSAFVPDSVVDPMTGAAVGGAIGAAALPAAGLTIGAVGTVGVGAAKIVPGMAMGAMKGAAAASPYVAGIGVKAAEDVASRVWGIGSRLINWDENADAFGKVKFTGPISGIKSGWNSGRAFTKEFSRAEGFGNKLKAFAKNPIENSRAAISKSGKAAGGTIINGKTLIGGTALIEGAKKAWNTVETAKMGQMTGVTTMTPQIPSYADNAGATGDLVFALNANRRG